MPCHPSILHTYCVSIHLSRKTTPSSPSQSLYLLFFLFSSTPQLLPYLTSLTNTCRRHDDDDYDDKMKKIKQRIFEKNWTRQERIRYLMTKMSCIPVYGTKCLSLSLSFSCRRELSLRVKNGKSREPRIFRTCDLPRKLSPLFLSLISHF